mgnify:CR=1 FL=1
MENMSKTFEINNIEGLSEVSRCIVEMRKFSNIVAFYGPMGAGKTTLIKNLCHSLGVVDEVNSPTFALVNEYVSGEGKPIYHFDFYRIKKLEEVYDIGYEDYFYSGHLCLLEWPQMIEPLMPERYVRVDISLGESDSSRKIEVSVAGW